MAIADAVFTAGSSSVPSHSRHVCNFISPANDLPITNTYRCGIGREISDVIYVSWKCGQLIYRPHTQRMSMHTSWTGHMSGTGENLPKKNNE